MSWFADGFSRSAPALSRQIDGGSGSPVESRLFPAAQLRRTTLLESARARISNSRSDARRLEVEGLVRAQSSVTSTKPRGALNLDPLFLGPHASRHEQPPPSPSILFMQYRYVASILEYDTTPTVRTGSAVQPLHKRTNERHKGRSAALGDVAEYMRQLQGLYPLRCLQSVT